MIVVLIIFIGTSAICGGKVPLIFFHTLLEIILFIILEKKNKFILNN